MATMRTGWEQQLALETTQVKRAAISGATSGNNTVVAAVTGKKIKVLALHITAAAAVDVRFEDGAGGDPLTGVMSLTDTNGLAITLPAAPPGYHWFETTAATLLNMELGGAVQVSGCLVYYEE